jgi:membrane protein DedA with SNARE-associated domain
VPAVKRASRSVTFSAVETLLELTEPWLYILVFLLAAAEGAALVGLVLPGESSMLLGGVVVYQGNADALLIYVCGIAGAIIGDSLGYWAGRRFGARLRASRLGQKVGSERWERAGTYLRERGGRAIFFGRFAGFLRTLVPPVAGQAEVPYRRFVAFNAPAAALWAIIFISLGLAAGSSWHTVERWSGRASAFVAILVVAIVGSVLVARWLLRHREAALTQWERSLNAPVVRSFRRRFERQISFMKRRFDPAERFGLYFSLGAIAALVTGVALAELLDALREGDELGRFDRSVATFARENRSERIDRVASALTGVLNSVSLTIAVAFAAVVAWKLSGRILWLLEGAAAVAGAAFLDDLVRFVLDATNLHSPGQFPSGDSTSAIVLAGLAVYIAAWAKGWRMAVWVGTVGSVLMFVVTLAYAYEGVLASALVGGMLLGLMWLAICGASVAQFATLGTEKA